MPLWIYNLHPALTAVLLILAVETVALLGLAVFRRLVLPHLEMHEGINDAVSGTVQAIGVFYGITVGLIAVGVWNTWSNSSELVAREAAYISALYSDLGALPETAKGESRSLLRDYTTIIVEDDWPAQTQGRHGTMGEATLARLETVLQSYEPRTAGDGVRYHEILSAYNRVLQQRRLRIDAVDGGLSDIMWAVIWVGAALSIGVAYFFDIRDARVHATLIALMAGFLAMVLYLIVMNDKPFYGRVSISDDSYKLILTHMTATK